MNDMNTKSTVIEATCDLDSARPAFAELPYPPTQVSKQNKYYADLLSVDYCGMVSELSAVTQYIDNEIRLSKEYCEISQTILSVAMAEMTHMQILGELILLLGGKLTYTANYNCEKVMWSPDSVDLKTNPREILLEAIFGEQSAIHQYKKHIKEIKDTNVTAVLARIIKDEEYHIFLFRTLLEKFDKNEASKSSHSKSNSSKSDSSESKSSEATKEVKIEKETESKKEGGSEKGTEKCTGQCNRTGMSNKNRLGNKNLMNSRNAMSNRNKMNNKIRKWQGIS